MNIRARRLMLVCIVSLSLLLLPVTTAFGFGKGTSGSDVHAVQAMLKSMGYFSGSITGYYGSKTEAAVRKFQATYGLPVTGAVDDRTLESILWAYGNMKISKKPTPAPTPIQTPAPTPVPTPTPTPTPAPAEGLTAEEQQMVDLVNKARQEAGLKPLIADAELSKAARAKSQDMVVNNYFSHQSPTYGSPFEMMRQFGISYRSAGENIACNQSVTAAHQALMNSEGHRANILNADFTHIGIGIVDGGPCGKMFTQQFVGR